MTEVDIYLHILGTIHSHLWTQRRLRKKKTSESFSLETDVMFPQYVHVIPVGWVGGTKLSFSKTTEEVLRVTVLPKFRCCLDRFYSSEQPRAPA